MPDFGEGWQVSATIRSALHPDLFFECDLMIDTGCKVGAIALPLRKVQQLKLNPTGKTKQARTGSAIEPIKFYDPVKIELKATNDQVIFAYIEPFVTPRGARLNTRLSAEAISSGTGGVSSGVVPISPVKFPIPENRDDLETPLLGASGLRALGLGLDMTNHCLFPLEEHDL